MRTPSSPRRLRRRASACFAVVALACTTLVVLAGPASAAVSTTDLTQGATPTGLANQLAGDTIDVVGTVSYTGAARAAGSFTGGAGIVGLDSGVVLSSGDIANVVGPNDAGNTTYVNGTGGDNDLTTLAGPGATTFDAAVLEFDFVPSSSQVQFSYVFSSEEYNEYVDLGFNDVFGFFVNGTNCAVVGGSTPVSIDTINAADNPDLFINNETGALDTEMDGLTVVLTCSAPVTAGATNHIKLAIADTGDSSWDSAVFLGANTFVAVHTLTVTTAGDGSGTVTSDPAGIDCGEDCTEDYEEGSVVTLTATPDEGSTFAGWSGACTGTTTCQVTMNAAANVTATFEPTTTSCPEGSDCDAGTVPPGGSLSTVQGTSGNPVTSTDPFALQLKNVSGQPMTGSIVEEECDGTQESDPLCSEPKVGNSAGNFQFTFGGGAATLTTNTPVSTGRLYYDKTVITPGAPIRIFYQKAPGDPVVRLRRCDDGRKTECWRLKKLASGDQIIVAPFSTDPRIARG